jgi:hypothetical protein
MKVCKVFLKAALAALCLGSLADSQYVEGSIPTLNYSGAKNEASSKSPPSSPDRDLSHALGLSRGDCLSLSRPAAPV